MLGRAAAVGKKLAAVVDAFERREDVLGVVTVDAVEVEIRGVELSHQANPFFAVPFAEPALKTLLDAAAGEATGVGQRQHVLRRCQWRRFPPIAKHLILSTPIGYDQRRSTEIGHYHILLSTSPIVIGSQLRNTAAMTLNGWQT
jgi:hypothetical protein